MKIDEIKEVEKMFIIRLCDEMGDFEDIEVTMCSEFADPKSEYFTHSEVKINTLKNRTIDEHIAYLQVVCKGLEQLKEQLRG